MPKHHRLHRFIPASRGISRRAIAQGALSGGIFATLLATSGQWTTRAQATPAASGGIAIDAGPRRYELSGDQTKIVFTPAMAGETAGLDYRDATTSLSFTGDEIELTHSQSLGPVAVVILETVADGFVKYLTLLVPEVNREDSASEVSIHALAILTSHLTSIGGPALVKGALQTYGVIVLDGVAEFGPA